MHMGKTYYEEILIFIREIMKYKIEIEGDHGMVNIV